MDEFAEGIVTPIVKYQPLEKKKFQPWHKPRKQWCRYNQWLLGLSWVIDTADGFNGEDSEKTFNYLGLPGDDLLDLRLFADGCQRKGVKLKYLGFKTTNTNELRLSESELHKKRSVASGSKMLVEPLESLARKESSAYVEAKQYNGFHMINFDLCKSIAKPKLSGDTYFEALGNLLELQTNYMREPWTLFITTYACKESVIDGVMKPLLMAVKDNNDKNPTFTGKLRDELLIEAESVVNAIEDLSLLTEQEFFDLFALGLSKWLLKICLSVSKAWKVVMTPSCKYMTGGSSRGGEPNMLSLAFRFEYVHQPANDEYDLISPRKSAEEVSELDSALDMVTKVGEIFNLDLNLENNKKLAGELAEHSADLLADARYEREEYFDWVKAGCPSS